MEQKVCLVDIMEPCILGVAALGQLCETVDTIAKWLLISTGANPVHVKEKKKQQNSSLSQSNTTQNGTRCVQKGTPSPEHKTPPQNIPNNQ